MLSIVMKKKIIALGLCVVLAMTTVTGCGKKSSKSSEKEETVSMAATDLAGKSVKFTVKLNYINKMNDQFVKDNEGYLTYFMYQYFSVANSYSDLKSVEEDMKRGLRTTNVISDVFSKLQSETKVEENQDAINKYIADKTKPYQDYADKNSSDLATVLKQYGYETQDEFNEQLKKEYNVYVILCQIAKENNLKVTANEYNTLANAMVTASEGQLASVEDFEAQYDKQAIIDNMLAGKAYYQIAKSVKETDAEDTEETTADGEEDKSKEVEVNKEIPNDDSEALAYTDYGTVVTIPDFTKYEVSKSKVKVTEQDVKSFEAYIISSGNFKMDNIEKDKKSKVTKYDVVNIDYTGKINGKVFSGGEAKDYNLAIGSNSFIEGFETGLIGKKAGTTATLKLKFPDDYGQTSGSSSADTAETTAEGETQTATVEETTAAE